MKLIERWIRIKWAKFWIWISEKAVASNRAEGTNEELVNELERRTSDLKAVMKEFDL